MQFKTFLDLFGVHMAQVDENFTEQIAAVVLHGLRCSLYGSTLDIRGRRIRNAAHFVQRRLRRAILAAHTRLGWNFLEYAALKKHVGIGHGRIAECLCEMAAFLAFRPVVIDPAAEPRRYSSAERLICDDWTYAQLAPAHNDFVVIATQHKGDHQSMKQALSTSVRYIALIASHKRAGLVLNYLREEGFRESDLARVYAPAWSGWISDPSQGIALSVIGEIVAFRHNGSGARLRKPSQADNVSLLPSPRDRGASRA